MRKLVLKMSMSLDGFVAGTGAEAESDWALRASTPDSAAWVLETLSGAGIHAVGRRLFESWIGFWPTATSPMAQPINDIPKIVFTRQQTFEPRAPNAETEQSSVAASWAGARVARGDLAVEIERLKQESGDYILAQGGLEFGRSLVQSGLVDEYRFVVAPVALGAGEGLFTGVPKQLDLELVSSTAFSGGVMANVYRSRA